MESENGYYIRNILPIKECGEYCPLVSNRLFVDDVAKQFNLTGLIVSAYNVKKLFIIYPFVKNLDGFYREYLYSLNGRMVSKKEYLDCLIKENAILFLK
jgi:hypothetical protein